MDKSAERKLFDCVYGSVRDWEVVPSEAPDFLCERNRSAVLGVEVTELWQNESLARLNKIDGYALDLLDGGKYRHKDDKTSFEVGPVTYVPGGQRDKAFELTAISGEVPDFKERLALLEGIIASKEEKTSLYEQICPVMDLLIGDSSSLFSFDKFESISCPTNRFVNRGLIIDSSFREIFLITRTKGNLQVFIPLKLNLFVEDISIFERLVTDLVGRSRDIERRLEILLRCLCSSGYGDLYTYTETDGFGIIVGGHLYLYSPSGKEIRDYLPLPGRLVPGEKIVSVLHNVGKTELKIVDEILKQRRDRQACMPLYFEAGNGSLVAGKQRDQLL